MFKKTLIKLYPKNLKLLPLFRLRIQLLYCSVAENVPLCETGNGNLFLD